jgi:uncharacterized protein (DUF2267 family)
MNRSLRRTSEALVVVGGIVLLRPGTPANRLVRRQVDALGKRLRHTAGQLRGISYRVGGRQPNPDVIDSVLVDRVRSSLGPLEKRLDVPRVHVTADRHVVSLHGEVGTTNDAAEIERAVTAVSGVDGVESYLHIGLSEGTTRPSEGREVQQASAASRLLRNAAVQAGAPPEFAADIVRCVLATFGERIPEGERDQVAAHLPADVRPMLEPPRRTIQGRAPRTTHALVARILSTTDELPLDRAENVVLAVMAALRSLVPEEAGDVAAVLPVDLRAAWQGERVTGPVGGRL